MRIPRRATKEGASVELDQDTEERKQIVEKSEVTLFAKWMINLLYGLFIL